MGPMVEIVRGRLDAQLPLPRGHFTGTVRVAVDAVADAVEQANANVAEIQALADILREAAREGVSAAVAAARIEQQPRYSRPSKHGCELPVTKGSATYSSCWPPLRPWSSASCSW